MYNAPKCDYCGFALYGHWTSNCMYIFTSSQYIGGGDDEVSTLKIGVASPIQFPDDSHTTIEPSKICPCGIARIDCDYHKSITITTMVMACK